MGAEAEIIQSIGVSLVADLTPLNAGLSIGLNAFKSFVTSASDILGGLEKKIGESFSVVTDQMRKSGNLRATIMEFQALTYAAQQTDTPMSSVNTALRMMEKNIGAATLGSKKMLEIFKVLGLDAKSLATMGLEAQLLKVADAMAKITNTPQKYTLMSAMFGARGGAEMISFLEDFKRKTEEFSKVTVPFSEFDGARIAGAEFALRKLEAVFVSIYNAIATYVSPIVTNLINKLLELSGGGRAIGQAIDKAWLSVENFAINTLAVFGAMYDVLWPITKFFIDQTIKHYNIMFDGIRFAIAFTWDNIKMFWNGMLTVGTFVINSLSTSFTWLANTIADVFSGAMSITTSLFTAMANSIINQINAIIHTANGITGKMIPTIPMLGQSGGYDPYNTAREPWKAPQITNEILDGILKNIKFGGMSITDVTNTFASIGNIFGKNGDWAKKIVLDLFHGKAEDEARWQVGQREKRRDANGNLLPPMVTAALGFAENLSHFGGNPMLNAIALQMARSKVTVQEVSDKNVLDEIRGFHNDYKNDGGWGVAD